MATSVFTVLYKTVRKFDTDRTADPTVYSYTTAAVDAKDAVRQLKASRAYRVQLNDGRFALRFRSFKVVEVISGERVKSFTNYWGHADRKVVVLKARQPRWMSRNFFGKGR